MPGRKLPAAGIATQRPDSRLLELRRRGQRQGSAGRKEARQKEEARKEVQEEGKEARQALANRQAQPRGCQVSPAKKLTALAGLCIALLVPASAQADFGFVPGSV